LVEVIARNDAIANIFGRGIGAGSNQTSIFVVLEPYPLRHALQATELFYADSTVTWLLVQFGFAGILAFYAMLSWAFAKDRAARPFYLALAIASLTINIPEFFPVNFLLGLALAHSIWRWKGAGNPGDPG
jgi:hypothetical protein